MRARVRNPKAATKARKTETRKPERRARETTETNETTKKKEGRRSTSEREAGHGHPARLWALCLKMAVTVRKLCFQVRPGIDVR